ncbi:MAG: methionyl-tRNA formyltransferase, partial [Clostridia bacterium]|nr:methionyl-tRNA formyltransferase [Clostridia bacterium]
TPEFAVSILYGLIAHDHNETAEFTQTDKPKGRGNKMQAPPVKEYALGRGIPVYQPKTLRDEEVLAQIEEMRPDMIVVAAYGKIFPEKLLNVPEYGCINVHGSLLPYYRGAAPVQRCIINGEKITGVTIMRMDVGCDTGDMIAKAEIEIPEDMNCGELFEKMGKTGSDLLIKTLPLIFDRTAEYEKQDDSLATYSPKIEKSELMLDFNQPAEKLHDLIRGVYPLLACGCYQEAGKGRRCLRIAKAEVCEGEGVPGTVLIADAKDNRLVVACGEKALNITELIPEGKQKMKSADFIRGRQIKAGDILCS